MRAFSKARANYLLEGIWMDTFHKVCSSGWRRVRQKVCTAQARLEKKQKTKTKNDRATLGRCGHAGSARSAMRPVPQVRRCKIYRVATGTATSPSHGHPNNSRPPGPGHPGTETHQAWAAADAQKPARGDHWLAIGNLAERREPTPENSAVKWFRGTGTVHKSPKARCKQVMVRRMDTKV